MNPDISPKSGKLTPVVSPQPGAKVAAAIIAAVLLVASGVAISATPLLAQGFQWPWATETRPRPQPLPREPDFGGPPDFGDPYGRPGPNTRRWSRSNNICLQLEQRLVQEGNRAGGSREKIPALSSEISKVRRALRESETHLERRNCYSYFLFSKTLKRTRRCLNIANKAQDSKRRLAELEGELQRINSSSNRSYQDDIIRELARNNCGANYQQQARRRDSNPFSSLWQNEDNVGAGGAFGTYNSTLPYATYRTLCVRKCDGYYFPISFSTLPNHFQRDADKCQQKCAAPAELFYYQNPGGAVEQMVSAESRVLYTELKTAFRYRKEYVRGCSCKAAEYVPASQTPVRQGESQSDVYRAEGPAIDDAWATKTQPQ